jgi:hypothetical protein
MGGVGYVLNEKNFRNHPNSESGVLRVRLLMREREGTAGSYFVNIDVRRWPEYRYACASMVTGFVWMLSGTIKYHTLTTQPSHLTYLAFHFPSQVDACLHRNHITT